MKKLIKTLVPFVLTAIMSVSANAGTISKSDYTLTINDKVSTSTLYVQDSDIILIPLRETAEELGWTVTWDEEKLVTIDNGTMNSTLEIGVDSYFVCTSDPNLVGMSAPFSLGSAPVIINERTYIPVDLITPLYGCYDDIVTIENKNINISTLKSHF